jgi:hypothetical protein
MLQVKLDDGKELIFLGETLEEDDPLVEDIEDYRHGRCSYAHWFPSSGCVMRYLVRISGKPTVLEDLGPCPAPADDFFGGFFGSSWGGSSNDDDD